MPELPRPSVSALADIASNCSVDALVNPATITVAAGEAAEVTFTVTCIRELAGRILFSANVDPFDRYDIYIMNADGSDRIQLTDTPDRLELGAVLSPDGTRIAYSRFEPSSGEQIFIMNADGSDQVQLTDDAAGGFDPAWSPDGRVLPP
jgi:tricorn protease-like protein